MSERLKGKVAVITGSGQGIGKAVALAMAREGAKVVTNNRRPGSTGIVSKDINLLNMQTPEHRAWTLQKEAQMRGDAETVAKEIIAMGGQAVPFFGNVAEPEVAQNLIKTAVDTFGKIDILVNNAGTGVLSPIWEMTDQAWHRVVNASLTSTFYCTRNAAGLMKEQRWGRIINCTSGAFLWYKYGANYASAKGAIVSFTRTVARDMWEWGVTCNAYSPSALTRMQLSGIMGALRVSQKRFQERMDAIPPGPELIAPFIAYLATDEAGYISGSVFGLRGGRIALFSDPEEVNTLGKVEDQWTVDQLVKQVPETLLKGYKTKAPQAVEKL